MEKKGRGEEEHKVEKRENKGEERRGRRGKRRKLNFF